MDTTSAVVAHGGRTRRCGRARLARRIHASGRCRQGRAGDESTDGWSCDLLRIGRTPAQERTIRWLG